MTSLTSTAQGYDRLLDLSRHLTRGLEAPLPATTPRTTRHGGLATLLAGFGERWARARAIEAWLELARHDHRMAQELRSAMLRAR